jgi:hypothetical protein
MPLILNGSTGVSGIDGSAGTPSYQGTDSNTGIFYGSDIVGISTGGTERMRIDSSGNVGIGATTITSLGTGFTTLQTQGTNGSGLYLFRGTSTNMGYLYGDSGGIFLGTTPTIPLRFYTADTERMRITSDGEVLVGGTTSINAATGCLTVQRTNDDPYFALFRNDTSIVSTNRIGNIDWYVNDTTSNTPTRVAYILGVASGDHSAGNNPTDLTFATTAAGSSTVTERMRIDSSGNVSVKNNAADNNYFELQGSQGELRLYPPRTGADYGRISTDLGAGLVFETNGALERMRITSAGFLCLGTTSKNADGLLSISADSSLYQAITIKDLSAGNNIYYIYFTNSSGGGAGRIEHTGSTTVSYVTSSDARLKTNIVDSGSAQPIIESIKIREFDWVSGEHQRFGVVAQELIDVAPEAVSVGRKEDDSWGVDYSKLVPHLIKYVQELNAKVVELEAKLNAK